MRQIADHGLANVRGQWHAGHVRSFIEVFVGSLAVRAIVRLTLNEVHPGPVGHKLLHLHRATEERLAVQVVPIDFLFPGNHLVR